MPLLVAPLLVVREGLADRVFLFMEARAGSACTIRFLLLPCFHLVRLRRSKVFASASLAGFPCRASMGDSASNVQRVRAQLHLLLTLSLSLSLYAAQTKQFDHAPVSRTSNALHQGSKRKTHVLHRPAVIAG